MDTAGELTAVGLNKAIDTVEVSFDVVAFGQDREIHIVSGTAVLSSFTASTTPSRVSVVLPVDTTVRLEPVAPPTPVREFSPESTDPRVLSIAVSNIGVVGT